MDGTKVDGSETTIQSVQPVSVGSQVGVGVDFVTVVVTSLGGVADVVVVPSHPHFTRIV